jgi:multiple sugar transport system permease protein
LPLILPAFFGGGAFNIFLLRQFFLAIPRDLDEAAEIDGAGKLRIFLQIILPLSKSALIVVALFTFLGSWNDFFGPIIYLNSKEKFTLAVGLLQFKGDYSTKWNLLMAASTIVVTPCILIYLVGQRYLIEGISLTGMKA